MSTKMKGLFKGLRYISQIFDEEQQKEHDMQIGLPTDVKHVAHVGWDDGPGSATSSDSLNWMKELGPSTPGIAAPFGDSKPGKDNAEVKWVSEDSKRTQKTKKSQEKEQRGEGAKPSRRRSTDNNPLDTSPKKPSSRRQSTDNKNCGGDTSSKPKQSRRNHPKDSSDGGAKPAQPPSQDSDVPKKTRRKKSESSEQAGPRRSKNRAAANGGDAAAEPGSDGGPAAHKPTSQLSSAASEDEVEREDRGRAAQMKESLQN